VASIKLKHNDDSNDDKINLVTISELGLIGKYQEDESKKNGGEYVPLQTIQSKLSKFGFTKTEVM
jgi:hypothetical protein